MQRMYILAGANGSGKSTIAKILLVAEKLAYVNPDDIAKKISPDNMTAHKVEAGRKSLEQIDNLLSSKKSFAVESTLSGKGYLRLIEKARRLGYETIIVYVFVDSPEVCIARISARVKAGGHYVPDEDVRRRYFRSKQNFMLNYAPAVDQWMLYYNGEEKNVLIAQQHVGEDIVVLDERSFDAFKEDLCPNL